MICGNCRFWGSEEEVKNKYDWRTCQAIKHDKNGSVYKYQRALEELEIFKNDPEYIEKEVKVDLKEALDDIGDSKALTNDGSGYASALKCSSDFGCVLFSPLMSIGQKV